jgi:hypothetical protein
LPSDLVELLYYLLILLASVFCDLNVYPNITEFIIFGLNSDFLFASHDQERANAPGILKPNKTPRMAKPKGQKTQPIAVILAEDLHKYHITAEESAKKNPQEIVYTEAVVIKILMKHGLPEPDFAAYSKIANDSNEGYMNKKRELLRLSSMIKEGMKKKGINNKQLAAILNINNSSITSLLSGANMTAATMLKLERALDIKLLNH